MGVDGVWGWGGSTILRRWAGEQAISSVVEMRTILVDALGVGFGNFDGR